MSITPYQAFHGAKLGTLIFPFLSSEDQRSLGQADTTWNKTKLNFEEVQAYQALKDRTHRPESITPYHALYGEKLMAQLFPFLVEKDQNSLKEVGELQSYLTWRYGTQMKKGLYIKDRDGLHQEKLLEVLGFGRSKKVFKLQKDRALAIPNMDENRLDAVVAHWKRIVHEEVAMSQLFNQMGFLSPLLERVNISVSENPHALTIPAYLSKTFENLKKTKGCFIIEPARDGGTWKMGKHFLFRSEEERFTEENWDSVMNLALTDIAKIAMHRLSIGWDTYNIAVVREPSPSAVSPYKVRPFFFDFSNRYTPSAIPQIQEKPSTLPFLNSILVWIVSYEFNGRDVSFTEEGRKIISFCTQLREKYSKEIASRMQQLLAAPVETETVSTD